MKRVILYIFLLLSWSAKAQTIQQFFSAYSPGPCQPVYFADSNVVCGFTNGDIITGSIDYDDGTILPLANIIVNNAGLFCLTGCDCQNSTYPTHTYATPGTYNVTITRNGPLGVSNTANAIVNVVGSCGTYSGYVYNDLNTNCVFNAGEAISGEQVVLKDITGNIVGQAWSDITGSYTLQAAFIPGAVYTLQYLPSPSTPCLLVNCPLSATYLINTASGTNLNFGLNSTAVSSDPYIFYINGSNHFQPGATNKLYLRYGNNLCNPMSGEMTFHLPVGMTFVSSVPMPNTTSPTELSWNLTNITGLGNNYIPITVILPTTNAAGIPYLLGDTICLHADFTPATSGDVNLSNNVNTSCLMFAASFDPNMKEVEPRGKGPEGNVIPGTDFVYTVHFQNTGTAPALQVKVMDTLDTDLDVSTLQILNHSHHMNVTHSGNIFTFDFPNIMLPDSVTDYAGSMGYLRYKVKHKSGLALGTVIENKAAIYFDLNSPVITNTTKNTLNNPTAVENVEKNLVVQLFPNPVNEVLNISLNQVLKGAAVCEMYNVTGAVVLKEDIRQASTQISTSHLPEGYYTASILLNGIKVYTGKFFKNE